MRSALAKVWVLGPVFGLTRLSGYDRPMQQEFETIGPYRIVGTLGRGGMGVVYKAVHRDTNAAVAVKTIVVPAAALLAGIRREVRALARLRHPGVVRIVDDGVEGGLPWYAMEFIEGPSLRSYLPTFGRHDGRTVIESPEEDAAPAAESEERNGLATGDALALVRRLCAPLGYIHGEGLVHRDLKPANVLVRDGGLPVLVDFGIALASSARANREVLESTGELTGTVHFMAPEQIRCELVDARTDLYALGCILYALLTGRPPFEGRRFAEVALAHLEEDAIPPSAIASDLPPELDELVLRLLAKQPADRLGHADDVAAALERIGVAGDTPPGWRTSRAYLYRPELVGRHTPVERLRGHVHELDRRHGRIVLVAGESGVGKTRLALECLRIAASRGARILTGAGTTEAGDRPAPPLEMFRRPLQAIADHCREHGDSATEEILGGRARLLGLYEPSLAELPGVAAEPEPAELPPGMARMRLFRALANTLVAFARHRKALLILDDLQWADELTRGFLTFLASRRILDDVPLLVLGTLRSEEADDELGALAESDGVETFRLGRLEPPEVAGIVSGMLAISPPPEPLCAFLARRSGGNPFFVAEYLRAAVDTGIVTRGEGAWRVAEERAGEITEESLERLEIPGSLRGLIAHRFSRLSGASRRVVAAGAIIGREFDADLVARVSGLDEDRLQDALGLLARRAVVEESGARLRFSHDQIRDTALEMLDDRERRAWHEKVAETLEARGARGDDDDAALGWHWQNAGNTERARVAFLRAARAARARYANREAERHYRSYLALAPAREPERVEALNELGALLFRSGHAALGLAEHERALEEAGAASARAAEGETLRMIGVIERETGRMAEAHATFERAVAIARETGDERAEGLAIGERAIVDAIHGRVMDAERGFLDALRIARNAGDRKQECVYVSNLALLNTNTGEYDRAKAFYDESLAIAREIDDKRSQGIILVNCAILYSDTRPPEEAVAYATEALSINREVGNRQFEAVAMTELGRLRAALGEPNRAFALFAEALEVHREIGNQRYVVATLWYEAQLFRRLGRFDDAERRLDESQPLAEALGDRFSLELHACERGHLALARGHDASEERRLAEALVAALDAAPRSQAGRALGRLARAIEAYESGAEAANGERLSDFPHGLRPDTGAN